MGITECDNMLMLLSVSQKMNDKVALCVLCNALFIELVSPLIKFAHNECIKCLKMSFDLCM